MMHQIPDEHLPLLIAELHYRTEHPGYYTPHERTLEGIMEQVWRRGIEYLWRRQWRYPGKAA